MKDFKVEKPVKDGDYWYIREGNKPRILEWDSGRQSFIGDADHYGPHSFIDPDYWADVEYPDGSITE